MKRRSTLFFLLCLATFISANVVLTEDFDYTSGTAIGDVDGWTTTGDITSGEGRLASDVVLNYSNTGGDYILSGSKSLKHNYTSNKSGSDNGTQYLSYRSFTKVESGAVYLTYMYKPDGKQSQANGELLGLTSGTTNPSARPWAGKLASGDTSGETYRIGLTMRSGTSSNIQWGSGVYSKDDVLLLVLKYDIANASASLFINPTLGTTEEPTADITDNNDDSPRTKIDAIMFRNQGASKSNYYVAGVRVSTSWAEAVEIMPDVVGEAYILTDFNDNTWGTISASSYTSGSFPSSTINGFQLVAAGMQTGSVSCAETSESFTNRISIDKGSNGGMVILPAVSNVQKVIVYASSGSENKDLKLQKYSYISAEWSDVATYNFAEKAVCYRFETTLNSNEVTRLRLVNADGSTKYIWKIQTCPYPPTVDRERFVMNLVDEGWSDLGTDETTATINEVEFTKCAYSATGTYALTGEKFEQRVVLGKSTGMIEMPTVASAARIDIYASAGSNNKNLKLQQYNYGLVEWEDVETLHFDLGGVCYRFSVELNSTSATWLRLVNDENSTKYIYKIMTFASMPQDLAAPEALEAIHVSAKSFEACWNAVEGATGYRVIRYKNGVRDRVETAGAGITMLPFRDNNITADTEYSYAVVAIGDNETTTDSDPSNVIFVTTTPEITDTYTRAVTNGNYGTICLPKAAADLSDAGAVFFAVAGKVLEGGKLKQIVFDEVTSLDAGKPYVFQATAAELNIPLTGDAVTEPDNSSSNGLIGAFTVAKVSSSVYVYVLSNNMLYCSKDQSYYVGENRAYFKVDDMSEYDGAAPAPGRRRVVMQTAEEQVVTALDEQATTNSCYKTIRNGQLIIIRNGEQYDVTGRQIK